MKNGNEKVNKYFPMKKHLLLIVMALMMPWFPAFGQFHHPDDFRERYTLKQVVVLSRHNIRSPLSGRQSALQRITPHEWHHWSSAPSELSLRGGALETMMGQYFRKWLVSEGLMQENEIPAEGAMRFYANSLQRTIATVQYFSSGMLPVANVRIEHHCEVGRMDSAFAPQITDDNETFKALAQQQIATMGGEKGLVGIGEKMSDNYKVLERVLDMEQSKACLEGDTCHFCTDDAHVYLIKHHEPGMGGSLRLACQAADALVLQYYEEPDAVKAAFGDTLTWEDWESISAIKDWYGDVLFTAPVVARQVARPLLRTMLEELQNDERRFTFLCGHDSNIGSVLAALEAEDYSLPNTIEKKTPIGCKLVIGKWEDTEGKPFASLNLVYQSADQLRNMTLLDSENPPMVFPIHLKGLHANGDGLYSFAELVQRFDEAVSHSWYNPDTHSLAIREAIERQMATYPESTLQDIYKSFYQDHFGPGHMITDTASARQYLLKELSENDIASTVHFEPTGSEGRYVRVYLSAIVDSLITAEQLLDAFIQSANKVQEPQTEWTTEWEDIVGVIRKYDLKVKDFKALQPVLTEAAQNHQAVHHSQAYREAYHPHYRIVEREVLQKILTKE